ncbi:MAG: EamA family transporter [Methanotrichaceae archaeon]|nr:EamA family transporter [Methanotrichaceae archaeon]
MNWFVLALMGMIFFTVAGILDKYILSAYALDSKAYVVCQVLAQMIFTIPIFFLLARDFIFPESAIALIAGVFTVIPAVYYVQALKIEEASRVSAMEYFYPVLVFLGATLLLGERLAIKDCMGGLLILIGVFLASYRHQNKMDLRNLSPAMKPFVVYWICVAIYFLTLERLLVSMDEWHLYAWSCFGMMMAGLPFLASHRVRQEFIGFFGRGPFAVGALIFEEGFMFLGIIFTIFACALGSAALVTSVGALQPIMTLLLVLGLGMMKPTLVEDIEGKMESTSLIQKCFSFMIIAVGIYLLC